MIVKMALCATVLLLAPPSQSERDSSEVEKPNVEKPNVEKSNGEKPNTQKSDAEKSNGEKSNGEKPDGEKSNGEKSNGEKPNGEKPNGEKPNGEKSNGEKSTGEKSTGEKADAEGAERSADAEKSQQSQWRQIELNIISYTNAERVKRGLPALKIDSDLMKSARSHASWMARRRSLTHTRRSVAENIAMGQRQSQDAVRAWMNSSGHRRNILNRNYQRIGAAAYRTSKGTVYWCQQFLR